MEKIGKFIKILIAIILIVALIYIGYKYYERVKLEESFANKDAMDIIYEEVEKEKNKLTYEDVNEDEKKKVEEYIKRIYLNFQGEDALPVFSNIRDVSKDYIECVTYLNLDLVENITSEELYTYERAYSYNELNNVLVKLFGKNGHNLFPVASDSSYFLKDTDGYHKLGMGGSEIVSNEFILDSVQKGSDGKYYAYIYDYIIYIPDAINLVENSKLKILNVDRNSVAEYRLSLKEEETLTTYTWFDLDGNEVSNEDYAEFVKSNPDKFVKREIVLEYDEKLELYYMTSNSLLRGK